MKLRRKTQSYYKPTILIAVLCISSACSGFQDQSGTTRSSKTRGDSTKKHNSLAADQSNSSDPSNPNPRERYRTESPQWPSFRGGAQNTGSSAIAVRAIRSPAEARSVSEFDTGGLVWATPVIDENGDVYLGAANKYFYSFTAEGQKRWDFRIDAKADSLIDSAAALVPAIKDNPALVVVPGGDGALHALNTATGERVWKFEAHGASASSHQSGVVVNSFEGNVQYSPAHQLIYAGSDNGTLYAVDPAGNEKWSKKTGMMIWTAALISPDQKWLAFGSLDGKLYLLDPVTGADIAHAYHGKSDIKSTPTTDGKGNIYFGNSNGELISMKVVPQSGVRKYGFHLNWAFKTGREIYSSPTYADGKVLFGSVDGGFYALNANDGTLAWKYNAYSKILSSPLVTQDKVVLFGAKNGKLYALNLQKGNRIWSYRAALDPIKSNLDASPAMDVSGMIHVGSYNGKFYHIPYEYCLTHIEDKERCEFGGMKDSHDYDVPKDQENLATLAWIPSQAKGLFDTSSPLQLRLVVVENREFIDSASIDSLSDKLHVELTPSVEFKSEVSSDGKYLNIIPKTFFAPDTSYKIKVSGLYYRQSHNFVWDRINPANWVGTAFEAEQTFKTKPAQGNPWGALNSDSTLTWGLKSMYLIQPEAMDTYTPAALDGQGALVTAFGFDPRQQKMIMLAIPAMPEHDGREDRFLLMPEPSKAFTLNSEYRQDNLIGHGAFTLAAMGGEMTLNPFTFSASTNLQTGNLDGQLHASTYCFSLKGNGAKYTFPLNLVNQLCDAYGYLHATGLFKGIRIQDKPVAASVTHFRSQGKAEAQIELKLPTLAGSHLFSVVQYDPKTVTVISHTTEIIPPPSGADGQIWTAKVKLKENCASCCKKSNPHPVAVFFDAQKLDLSEVPECVEERAGSAEQRAEQKRL